MTWKAKLADALFRASLLSVLITGLLLLFSLTDSLRGMLYWQSVAQRREAAGEWTGQEILPQYQSLYASNPDFVGWLSIEGTNYLDYPVMQTINDPEHYLWRTFEDEYSGTTGTPFADYRCHVVPVQGFNTVIYGHNGLFHRLYDYQYRNWVLYKKHRIIRFDTVKGEALYEVAAVFYLDAREAVLLDPWDPEHPSAYECYNYLEVDSPEGFRKFLDRIAERRIFEAEKEITLTSHIITLICCADEVRSGIESTEGTVNGRLIVIAAQI